ncbi:SDR family NAD(P)-dependent oxidoreductase [Duganella sp. Root336D2]|uniref:SDR family NAD(P)-dependent oxidoreductase n=1 Tax=Duganella sp. Root336D2 TaxID=1736518 RepID=UPI0006F48D99|nr:SDR family NAD(P)-dependent oxidoreductase [Duganella sp. Root336D2]KQV61562.1 short-chain dehydrogenase [Duganella sp. Root336D2]
MLHYDLTGRVVAITGATGGLGSALARELSARGARLALLDLDEAAISRLAQGFGGEQQAKGWRVDVRSYEHLQAAMGAAAAHFGRIDVVIANAGIDEVSPMATMNPDAFERVIDINLSGVWRTLKAGLPHVARQRGYLMAISSMAAFVHSPLQAHYTASKAGVWAMCDSVRLEVKHLGVGVGSVHPTFFRTPLMEQIHADAAGVKLWGGNKGGLWRMISRDEVVDGVIRGIERRSDMVVLPAQNTLIAKAPGLFRKMAERLGFKSADIVEAIALAERELTLT